MTARDRRTVRAAAWCHRRLLWLYPATFRAEYQVRQSTQAFRDRGRAAAADRGLAAVARAVVAGLADAAISGVLERASCRSRISRRRAQRCPRSRSASRVSIAAGAAGRELRLAARRLVREPTFTLVVVATLAIGIGAATTIFSVVHGVLLQPLPYRDADRVVTLWQWNQPKGIDEAPSPANFLDWRDASRTLNLAAAEPFGVDLTGSGDPIGLETWRVSERFFDVLGVTPALGRVFLPKSIKPERLRRSSQRPALAHAFGGDPGIVGQTMTLDGKAVVVAGVLPATVDYPRPRTSGSRACSPPGSPSRGADVLPGDRAVEARRDDRAGPRRDARYRDRLAAAYPRMNKGVSITVDPLFERVTGPVRNLLLLLLAAVGCVMFIASANAANLMLARAAARQAEIAVRRALGAGRLQLLRLTVAESVLLTFAAAAVASSASYWAVAGIVALAPRDVPRIDEVGLNWRFSRSRFSSRRQPRSAAACAGAAFWRRDVESALRPRGGRARRKGGVQPCARRRADRGGGDSPDRQRPARAQLRSAAARRSRLSRRQPHGADHARMGHLSVAGRTSRVRRRGRAAHRAPARRPRGRHDLRAAAVARGIGDGSAVHDPRPARCRSRATSRRRFRPSSRPDISITRYCGRCCSASPEATRRRTCSWRPQLFWSPRSRATCRRGVRPGGSADSDSRVTFSIQGDARMRHQNSSKRPCFRPNSGGYSLPSNLLHETPRRISLPAFV